MNPVFSSTVLINLFGGSLTIYEVAWQKNYYVTIGLLCPYVRV